MTLTMDKAGRIVLPKPLRERLQLEAGAELELVETAEGILLRPPAQQPLIKENGVWVHVGRAPSGLNWLSVIEQQREFRANELAGR